MPHYKFPLTPTGEQVDDYHGTKVPDPYRWLEDTESSETKSWIEAQNKLTFELLEKIPARQQIHERLTELWDYPKASALVRKGNRNFSIA